MKRTLLDEGVPVGLADLLGYQVHHVHDLKWGAISDAELIARAVRAGFEVLVSTDQNIPFQQNLVVQPIALVIICTTRWDDIRERYIDVKKAIETVELGSHEFCLRRTRRSFRGRRHRRKVGRKPYSTK